MRMQRAHSSQHAAHGALLTLTYRAPLLSQQVESYEYEMPSDFEDEEIDEEAAFTAEDKKKFGAWFDDIGGSDGEDGSEGFDDEEGLEEGEDDGEQPETGSEGDAGLDMLDSEDEGPAGQQQRAKGQAAAAGSKKRPRPQVSVMAMMLLNKCIQLVGCSLGWGHQVQLQASVVCWNKGC